MVGTLQPLGSNFKIVNPDGTPTDYFIQWAQQRQIDLGTAISQAVLDAAFAGKDIIAGDGLDGGGSLASDVTLTADVQEILDQISTTRGTVLYRGASAWAGLAPGTSGHFLKTNGSGADPAWAAASGGGGGAWTVIHNASIPNPSANISVSVAGYKNILVVARLVPASVSGIRQIVVSTDSGSTYRNTSGDYVFFSDTGAETNTTGIIGHGTATTAARTIAGDILGIDLSGTLKLAREIGGGRQRLFVQSTDPITDIRLENAGGGNLTGGTLLVMGQS